MRLNLDCSRIGLVGMHFFVDIQAEVLYFFPFLEYISGHTV